MTKLDNMMAAITSNKNFSGGNVAVTHDTNKITITLHGHTIAVIDKIHNIVFASWCGYATNVTTNKLRPIIQHYLGAGLEANAVRVQCIKGTPTITIGKTKHKVDASRLIRIECDQLNIIELVEPTYNAIVGEGTYVQG